MQVEQRENTMFTTTHFAKYSRTTRDTLLYYDKIGILSPATRLENNYRLYSAKQAGTVNLIRTGQALGMPLSEIRDLVKHRTPEDVMKLHEDLIIRIDEQLETWTRSKKLLLHLHNTIKSVQDIDEKTITIRQMPAEPIILGDPNSYANGKTAHDALLSFYKIQHEKSPTLDLNYPVWSIHSEESLKTRDWSSPSRYYFHNPDGPDEKPAALYAIGYSRCAYGDHAPLFDRMIAHIKKTNHTITGPAYEEYPLNELSIQDETNYLLRISIIVN